MMKNSNPPSQKSDRCATSDGGAGVETYTPADNQLRAGAFELGRNAGNGQYHFGGEISDVRLYDRPLSEDEVRRLAAGRIDDAYLVEQEHWRAVESGGTTLGNAIAGGAGDGT